MLVSRRILGLSLLAALLIRGLLLLLLGRGRWHRQSNVILEETNKHTSKNYLGNMRNQWGGYQQQARVVCLAPLVTWGFEKNLN